MRPVIGKFGYDIFFFFFFLRLLLQLEKTKTVAVVRLYPFASGKLDLLVVSTEILSHSIYLGEIFHLGLGEIYISFDSYTKERTREIGIPAQRSLPIKRARRDRRMLSWISAPTLSFAKFKNLRSNLYTSVE